jgi:hypothetical protein
VGLIQSGMNPEQRRESYSADVTYVTNSELGFDYLRDNIAGVSILSLGVPLRAFCHHDAFGSSEGFAFKKPQ